MKSLREMNGKDFWTEAVRYLDGEMDPDEYQAFEQCIDTHEKERNEFDKVKEHWMKVGKDYTEEKYDTEQAWKLLYSKLSEDGLLSDDIQEKGKVPLRPINQVLRIAAIVFVLIGLGWGGLSLWRQWKPERMLEQISYAEPLVVPVNLPDGSKVYLNRDSRLLFPKKFSEKNRKVTLIGEAYFEVEPDPEKPFLVETEEATVRVMGTTFNVNANNNTIEVLVTSGKVSLQKKKGTEEIFLSTGDLGTLEDNTGLKKSHATDPNYLSWKTRKLVFQGTPLKEVALDLERAYGIKMSFENDSLGELRLTSTFEQLNQETVVRLISTTFNLKYSGGNKQYLLQTE